MTRIEPSGIVRSGEVWTYDGLSCEQVLYGDLRRTRTNGLHIETRVATAKLGRCHTLASHPNRERARCEGGEDILYRTLWHRPESTQLFWQLF